MNGCLILAIGMILWAIAALQANGQFYNYEIFQSAAEQRPESEAKSGTTTTINAEAVVIVEQNYGTAIAQQNSQAE